MKKHRFLTLLFLVIFFPTIYSQSNKKVVKDAKIEVTYAKFLGKTPPVRTLVPLPPTTQERRKQNKDRKREIPNFAGRKKPAQQLPGALPKGEDPVRQKVAQQENGLVIEPLVNMDGLASNFGAPHDPTCDIGMEFFIQGINATTFRVFDKNGDPVSNAINANTIWSSIGFSSAGDPIIMYDQEFDRWILTEFPNGNQLLFAISETNDPMGSWMAYNFGTPNFPDYPKYSIWNNAYVVTTNEQSSNVLPAYFIDRAAMLSGAATVPIQRIQLPGFPGAPGFFVATPVDWTGDTPPPTGALPMILRLSDDAWGGASQDQIDVFEIDIDWDNANNTVVTTTNVPTQPFDTNPCAVNGPGFACIPQLGGGGIDGLPEVIMHQVHYRNFGSHESMVLNFITDATGSNVSGIRWMELRRTTGADWEVYQEGTYAPDDGLHRFMGAICQDASGNIGLAYSVSSPDIHPGIRFTGRRASDPLGEMTVDEYIAVEGTSTNPSFRFGDYAHMSLDPVNQKTFWFTGEYMGSNGARTRIVAFELGRDTTDFTPTALVTPESADDLSASEVVEIQIKNVGLDTQSVFNVGYILDNGAEVVESVTYTLYPDSTYNHTFATTADLSNVGSYKFKIFNSVMGDDAIFNDTARFTIEKYPRWDAGISDILSSSDNTCGDSVSISIVLTNFGTEILTSADIDLDQNGNDVTTFPWTGSLMTGESANIDLTVAAATGNNNFVATSSNPSGMTDEVPANDSFTRDINVITNGVSIFVNILTDNFPEETTWEVADGVGNVLFSGGPYMQDETLFVEEICLNPDECYSFTIFDAYGDGICCGYGQGNYSITDANGFELLSDDGMFGFEETHIFCGTFDCALEGDVDVSPESTAGASDGVLMITPLNPAGNVQFSIDGGQNFQSSGLFNNLPAGEYDVVIMDDAGCTYETTVTIETCTLDLTATTTNEIGTGALNGTIEVDVSTGVPPYEYSIDGTNFQSSNIFTGLGTGDYTVIVRDAAGCERSLGVFVDFETNTDEQLFGQTIEVMPNPTDGVFRINVKGLDRSDNFLPFEIYDVSGKLIQASQLAKYDDKFTGQVSLVVYPAGTYFVRFLDEKMNRLVRVVRL